jgi:hypothetical protein
MTPVRGRTESPPARHEPASPWVLIIEDEPALLRALRINLRARGFDVITAATGREGLAEARRRPPRRPAPPASPADRARDGLPLPTVTRGRESRAHPTSMTRHP